MFTFTNDANRVSFTNINAAVGVVMATNSVIVGPTSAVSANEVIGKLKCTFYIRLK